MLLTCYNVTFSTVWLISIHFYLYYFVLTIFLSKINDWYIHLKNANSFIFEWNGIIAATIKPICLNIKSGDWLSDGIYFIRITVEWSDGVITSVIQPLGSPTHQFILGGSAWVLQGFEYIDASKPTKCLILVPFCSQIAVKLNKSISQIESNQNHRANPITLCLFALFFQMISSSLVLRISWLPFIWCHVYREVVDYLLGHSSVFTAPG